jgi:hypothetical protein
MKIAKTITFDKSAKKFILDSFDKSTDDQGYIVEKNNPTQRVLSPDGQEVELDKFAGIKKGSQVFIRSDLVSIINLSDSLI